MAHQDNSEIIRRYQVDDYLKLKPKEVDFWGIVLLLLCNKKMEAKAFNSQQFLEASLKATGGLKRHLLRNGQAVCSLAAQKLMLRFEDSVRIHGQNIEKWLNLLSSNGNIFKLLLDKLRGRVKEPEPDTDAYVSFIGHLDSRVELDKSIQPGNPRYNSALAAMASKLAYENKVFIMKTVKEHWKMEFIDKDIDFDNEYQNERNTQGFVFHDPKVNKIFVAFRGTEPFNLDDWSTDLDISCFSNSALGTIHGGFMKALGLVMGKKPGILGWPRELQDEEENGKKYAYYSIRKKLRERLEENQETKFIVTGHSLGGALAILFAAILVLHDEKPLLERLEGVYTFGQPRVGDIEFAKFVDGRFKEYGIKYLRFVYCNDIIPRVPFDVLEGHLYHHFGTCLYFDSCYRGQKLEEAKHKNYFSKLGFITKRINALSELLRTLYLPLLAGPEYREGLPLVFVRFLAFLPLGPGMVDHNPQDYVNATRLGTYKLFAHVESSYSNSN